MALPELQKIQHIVRFAIGISDWEITPLGRGATSAAWYVTDGTDEVIVRLIPPGTNRPTTYQSEFTILRLLEDRGCPVPQPILNSAECVGQLQDIPEPWAVTRVIKGQAIKKGRLPIQTARDLGELLAIVHTLPTEQYGRLGEQKDLLCGLQADPLSGIQARWCWAEIWPFDHLSLAEHCVAQLAPHLISELELVAPSILKMIEDESVVLTHSDLHGEHIFTQNERLTGIIDFGVAFIGTPAWDFAVVAFYHGWDVLREVLIGYSSLKEKREYHLAQTFKITLVVSLYKLSKAFESNAPQHKIQRIVEFTGKTLSLLS